MERLKNPKLIAALLVAVLAIIVFLQNRAPVVLKMLFLAKVETSLATAMLGAFLAGVVTGALAFSRWKSQRAKAHAGASSDS